MTAALLSATHPLLVPANAPADIAVAPNFERFDGFEPLDHPGSADGVTIPYYDAPVNAGSGYGPTDSNPRPGQTWMPLRDQTYTPSTLARPVGTVGGQPLPRGPWKWRAMGTYTPARAPTVQWRLGVGQHGPSSLGAEQTVTLSEITNNPPQPGDLTGIIAGIA